MKIQLPKIETFAKSGNFRVEPPASALKRWHPEIHAADDSDSATINIYGSVGEDWDGSGVTVKMVAAMLRNNKGKDIAVNINSPGGDFFEGIAIYNALRDHDGEVNVKIIGLAASAASVVAMAGDTIEIAESAFLMIHNAWTIALGDRHDMEEVAAMLGKFDESMQSVYAKRAGITVKEAAKIMDAETWISGKDAIEQGFATGLLADDELSVDDETKAEYSSALRKVDLALAKQGIPRSERRSLIKELSGTPCAADDDETTPRAGDKTEQVLSGLLDTLTSFQKEYAHG